MTYPITVKGQLSSVEEFRNITIKSQVSAARVTLADVARVESGLQSYAFGIRENGVPATAAAIQLSPGANAISTASGIRARLTELSGVLPEGMTFTVPFDTAPFVKLSILKVVETFVEAMVLVFFVMLLFPSQDTLYAYSCDCGTRGAARHIYRNAIKRVIPSIF
ncbi:efflux RND transporter permease subunit [Klebsiella pneumoniae subsp. pneumoniae]|nr:efflux RND transporter permease subunit [Klebsiella pneumoniae subsp. pneumoniae]